MPLPCGGNNVLYVGVFGLPAQYLHRLLAGGNQGCRVAGAAGFLSNRDGVAGHAAGRFDDLTVGETLPVAQIKGGGGISLAQIIQRKNMCVNQATILLR